MSRVHSPCWSSATLIAMGAWLGSACGEEDCDEREVIVSVTVDGRAPSVCANWELQVRACGSGSCGGGCGDCVDGAPDPACEPIDVCEEDRLELPPGDWHLCVRAVLVNGGLEYASCVDTTVGEGASGGTVALAVDTEDAFPCIRDWHFDGAMCCHEATGCVAPED